MHTVISLCGTLSFSQVNKRNNVLIMGKTVTTYLIDGDPKGAQYVFISNKIC